MRILKHTDQELILKQAPHWGCRGCLWLIVGLIGLPATVGLGVMLLMAIAEGPTQVRCDRTPQISCTVERQSWLPVMRRSVKVPGPLRAEVRERKEIEYFDSGTGTSAYEYDISYELVLVSQTGETWVKTVTQPEQAAWLRASANAINGFSRQTARQSLTETWAADRTAPMAIALFWVLLGGLLLGLPLAGLLSAPTTLLVLDKGRDRGRLIRYRCALQTQKRFALSAIDHLAIQESTLGRDRRPVYKVALRLHNGTTLMLTPQGSLDRAIAEQTLQQIQPFLDLR